VSATATSRHSLSPPRLHNFVEKASEATLAGDTFDDAVTGQGLLNFFVRRSSGALTLEEGERDRALRRRTSSPVVYDDTEVTRLDYGRLMRILDLVTANRSYRD
jgi:hypothetical protein